MSTTPEKEATKTEEEKPVVYADTEIKIYTLKSGEEVYGYKESRKVDEVNDEVIVLQTLGYVENGSLYLGTEFTYISGTTEVRDMTVEEYAKLTERFNRVEEESKSALVKIEKLRTL